MFDRGFIDIGYYIKKRLFFKIRIKERIALGAFQVTFNRNCTFVYKSATICEGYSIRRPKWHQILNASDQKLSISLKQQILKRY